MFKTYDNTAAAWKECAGKYYDSTEAAWVDVPSAKTYDTTEAAWIERLYCGWFAVKTKSIQSTDTLEVEPSRLYFENDYKTYGTQSRSIVLELTYDYKEGDVIEFDLVANAGGTLTLMTAHSSGSSTLYIKPTGVALDDHISVTIGSVGNETSKKIRLSTSYYYNNGAYSAIVEVKNFKINGKKYGFAE